MYFYNNKRLYQPPSLSSKAISFVIRLFILLFSWTISAKLHTVFLLSNKYKNDNFLKTHQKYKLRLQTQIKNSPWKCRK